MPTPAPVRPSPRARGLVGLWCALWLVVGVWTGYEVWQLSSLSATVGDSGRALDEAGQALESVGQVPVVGDTTEELGTRIRTNAADIVRSAGQAGESIRRLSVLLGLTIAVVPTVPVVVGYRLVTRSTRAVPER